MATEQVPQQPKAKWRWLLNNGEGVRGFAMPAKFHEASKSLTPDANVFTIAPGPNVVDARKWEALKAADAKAKPEEGESVQSEIARLLATKIPKPTHRNRYVENEGKAWLAEGPAVANNKAPLEGLSETDALAIVAEMIEENMVRANLAVEKRPAVNEALHRVLDSLVKGHSLAAVG